MQGHGILFGELWNDFNTFPIPILHYKKWISKATNLVKRAKSKEEFKQLMKGEKEKELRKLFNLIQRSYPETIRNHEIFPCRDARNAATGACYGTLEAFVHLLDGTVSGWEADEVRSVIMNTDILVKEVDNVNPSSCEVCGSTRLLSCRTCKRKLDYCGNCGPQLDSCKCCSTIRPGDIDTDPMRCVDAVSYERHTKPIVNSATTIRDKAEEVKRQSMQSTLRKRKRVRFSDVPNDHRAPDCTTSTSTSHGSTQRTATDANATSDDSYQSPANKRRKLESSLTLEPTSTNRPSPPPPATHQRASRKRLRCNDNDDEHGCVNKRRQLESSLTLEPTSANRPSPPPPATQQGASRKRSRENDDIHDNVYNDNHRQKLQKSEHLAAYTANSSASPSITRVANEKVAGIEDGLRFRRSHRKTRNASQISTALQSPKDITFWELDYSGKPHSL